MNDEKEKYANGTPLDASKMSKEEKQKAIEYWCEGNQQLKQLLLYCHENGIETVGCCSGHEEELGYAYIGLKLGNEQDNEIIDLLTKLEIDNTDMTVAFIRGNMDSCFVTLLSTTAGNDEKFFENINQHCNQNIPNDAKFQEIRKKYEMLQTILIDSRAQEYTDYAEFSFETGDKYVRTVGFYKYDGNILNIPIDEIERMGQWLIDNPNADISQEFYGTYTKTLTYQINYIKEKCKMSKILLSSIKNAYKSIKNAVFKTKENIKMQEEGAR